MIDTPSPARPRPIYGIALAAVLLLGVFLRVYPSASMKGVGFDEVLYRVYVQVLAKDPLNYDTATASYLVRQSRPNAMAELPPTRFLYILCGYVVKQVRFGDAPLVADLRAKDAAQLDPILRSLRTVSAAFSIGLLLLSGAVAWRMAGPGAALAVSALIACAPLQIHMSQHAMIDGVLAFWAMLALWGLWECLHHPERKGWLLLYGGALFCMVLTKENAFFVFCALCGLLILNRWAKWGSVGLPLLTVTFLAPALAVGFLTLIAGGPWNFLRVYQLLVANAQHLEYAIETGDGPWYRYLVDLMVLSPVVLCLAIAAAFRTWRETKWVPYVLGFIAVSYLIMCNVRYGMNLRYATIWDLPLSLLVLAQITWSARAAGSWSRYVLPALVALVCLHELHQYRVFFVQEGLYELGPPDLLHAVRILK